MKVFNWIIRIISYVVLISFLNLQVSYAYPIAPLIGKNLSVESSFSLSSMSQEADKFKGTILEDVQLLSSVLFIGKCLLGDIDKGEESIPIKYFEPIIQNILPNGFFDKINLEKVVPIEVLREQKKEEFAQALEELGLTDLMPEEGVVFIPVQAKHGDKYLIEIAHKDKVSSDRLAGYELPSISDKYLVKIISGVQHATDSKIRGLVPSKGLSQTKEKLSDKSSLEKGDITLSKKQMTYKILNFFFGITFFILTTFFMVACGRGSSGASGDIPDTTGQLEASVQESYISNASYTYYDSGRVHFKTMIEADNNGTPQDLTDDISQGTVFEYTDEDVAWYGDMKFGYLLRQIEPNGNYKDFFDYYNKEQPRYTNHYYTVNNGISDGDFRIRRYEYDVAGRLLWQTRSDGSFVGYEYYGNTDILHYVRENNKYGDLLVEYEFDNNGNYIDKTGEEVIEKYYEDEEVLRFRLLVVPDDRGTYNDPSDDILGGTKYEYDMNGNLVSVVEGDQVLEEDIPSGIIPEGEVNLFDDHFYWYQQQYGDSQGIIGVEKIDTLLSLTCDFKGLHPEKSQGEVAVVLNEPMDLSQGKKIIMKIKVPEEFVATGMNGVMIFAKDNNGLLQYERWRNVKHSDEWVEIEYMPTTVDIDGQGYTFEGFNPSNLTELGLKISISCASDNSFQGEIQLSDIRIIDTDEVVTAAVQVDRYSADPYFAEPVTGEEFFQNSGVSFYFAEFERSIGTDDGISAHEIEIRELFESMNVQTARVWLSLGSGQDSGVLYSEDGTPIGFKNKELAVQDMVKLVRIAKDSGTRLVIMMHNSDLAEEHRDVLDDITKTEAMIELDRIFLNEVLAELGSDSFWIEAIDPMNEPDNTNTFLSNTQRFVHRVIDMAREVTGKPINMGPCKRENTGYWSWMLEAGDYFQIHWYDESSEEYGVKLYDVLKQNIGQMNLPEGVKVIVGEGQPSIGSESIIPGVIDAARSAGMSGVYFWFDNKINPEFAVNLDLLARDLVGLRESVRETVSFPEGVEMSTGMYEVKTDEGDEGDFNLKLIYDAEGNLLAEKKYNDLNEIVSINVFSQIEETIYIPEIGIDGNYQVIKEYDLDGNLEGMKFYSSAQALKLEEVVTTGNVTAYYKWSDHVDSETGRACLLREVYDGDFMFIESTIHSFDGQIFEESDGGGFVSETDILEGIQRYEDSKRMQQKTFPDGTVVEYYDEAFYDNGTSLIPVDDFGRIKINRSIDGTVAYSDAYFRDTDQVACIVTENGNNPGIIFYFRDQSDDILGYRWQNEAETETLDFKQRQGNNALYHKIDMQDNSELWYLWDYSEEIDDRWSDLGQEDLGVVMQKTKEGNWYKFPFKMDIVDEASPYVYWNRGLECDPLSLENRTEIELPVWPGEDVEIQDGDVLIFNESEGNEVEQSVSEDNGTNPLLAVVDSMVTSERAKALDAGITVVAKLKNNNVPEVETLQISSNATIYETAEYLEDIVTIAEKQKDPELLADVSGLRGNISTLMAIGFIGSMSTIGYRAKEEDQKLIIGIETDWIPGNEEGEMPHSAINSLLREIDSVGETLKALGLDNIQIIRRSKETLASKLLDEAESSSTSLSNIVVLAAKDTISSESFDALKSTDTKRKAFLAGVDASLLNVFYKKNKNNPDKQLRINIIKMLLLSLELASGKNISRDNLILTYDPKLRRVLFLPKPDPVNYNQLKEQYLHDRKSLIAA